MDREDLQLAMDGLDRMLDAAPLAAIDTDGGQGAAGEELWQSLTETGYPLLGVTPEHDGAGGSFADIAQVAMIAGRHALPLALVETMLGHAVLDAARCPARPDGAVALADPGDRAAPIARLAPNHALLWYDDGRLCWAAIDQAVVEPVHGFEDHAGRVRQWPNAREMIEAPAWLDADAFRILCATMRAAQMAGAMQSALALSLDYTRQREQFGRPLAAFQAIQHHLADMAGETAAATAAVELAVDALRIGPPWNETARDDCAIAKIRCGEAAAGVAAAAHQVHGAMGFTREYALGRFTRRLWQWQDDFGSHGEWAARLGEQVLAAPDPALWPRISHSQ